MSFNHVSHARLEGERSKGGGYTQAPAWTVATQCQLDHGDISYSAGLVYFFALAHSAELTRCEPTSTILWLFSAASTMAKPSATVCDIGFSQ